MALGRQHCRPGCIYSLRPAGIKVRINGSFILFSLQGAGIYVLVPRGLGRGGAILSGRAFKIEILKISRSALAAEICTGPHNRLLRRQHCSSLCSQSEGHEHVANMISALGHNFVEFSARAWPPQPSPPSLCEQSELQCFASGLRQMPARCPF